jgi:hypothetical protein
MGYGTVDAVWQTGFSEEAERNLEDHPERRGGVHAMRRMAYDSGYGLPNEDDYTLARTFTLAAENNPYAQVHFVWDEDDTFSEAMDAWFNEFLDAATRTGANNVHLHRSKRGDLMRYPHWFSPDATEFQRFYVPQALAGTVPEPRLAPAGRFTVLGFLKTRPFEVILGDGANAVARLNYEIGVDRGTFRFRRLSSDPDVRGRLRFRNRLAKVLEASVDGGRVPVSRDGDWAEVDFGLDDTVVVRGDGHAGDDGEP